MSSQSSNILAESRTSLKLTLLTLMEGALTVGALISSLRLLLLKDVSPHIVNFIALVLGLAFCIYMHYQLINKISDNQLVKRKQEYKISFALGVVFALAVECFLYFESLTFFSLFVISLCVYHASEYLFVCCYHYQEMTYNSFLINQSMEYGIAMGISFLEFVVELYLFGHYKQNILPTMCIAFVGMCLMFIGQGFRIMAEFTAQSNFHHLVQYEKREEHKLITHGVYKLVRHPGYFGWFLWSVGSQIMLCNPVSIVLFIIAAQKFFGPRVEDEEELLIEFFGVKYIEYMKRTPILIPGVKGFKLSE